MSTSERIPRTKAHEVATVIREVLSPACQEIKIAGSLRRWKPDVGDIEFVILPVFDLDLFGNSSDTYSSLEAKLKSLVDNGVIALDGELKCDGAKHKRYRSIALGCPVEFYIADHANFGNILTIRTGSTDYAHRLVTPIPQGGHMPAHLQQGGGYLKHRKGGEIIPCRTEVDYFNALGIPWVEPTKRDGRI